MSFPSSQKRERRGCRWRSTTGPLLELELELESELGPELELLSDVVSGDRPRELVAGQQVRYAFYDGRMSDLGSGEDRSQSVTDGGVAECGRGC